MAPLFPSGNEAERAWAAHEIGQLPARYALDFDSQDLGYLQKLFVPAAEPLSYPKLNMANVIRDMPGFWAHAGPTILLIGNHLIDFESEDVATGSVYCRAKLSLGDTWIEQAICYADRYVRTGAGWRFAHRRHMLFYGLTLPERPFDQAPTSWPRSAVGRGSLPEDWPAWRSFHGISAAPTGFYSETA